MPRAERKEPLPIVAGAIHTVCAMLNVRDDDLRGGINSGAIPVILLGKRRRIVVADAVAYLRTLPQARGSSNGT